MTSERETAIANKEVRERREMALSYAVSIITTAGYCEAGALDVVRCAGAIDKFLEDGSLPPEPAPVEKIDGPATMTTVPPELLRTLGSATGYQHSSKASG